MSALECHGEWYKHKILKADRLAESAVCHSYVVKNLFSCQKTLVRIHLQFPFDGREHSGTYGSQERRGTKPQHRQHTSEWTQRSLARVGTDWSLSVFLLANGERSLVLATCEKVEGEAPKHLLCLVMLHLPLDVFIWMWLSYGWKVSGLRSRTRTWWDMVDWGVQVPICSVFSFSKGSCPASCCSL